MRHPPVGLQERCFCSAVRLGGSLVHGLPCDTSSRSSFRRARRFQAHPGSPHWAVMGHQACNAWGADPREEKRGCGSWDPLLGGVGVRSCALRRQCSEPPVDNGDVLGVGEDRKMEGPWERVPRIPGTAELQGGYRLTLPLPPALTLPRALCREGPHTLAGLWGDPTVDEPVARTVCGGCLGAQLALGSSSGCGDPLTVAVSPPGGCRLLSSYSHHSRNVR